ncbi:MAG: aa3-type cytochrome c oxidase subunit IV [Methylobacterium frigidaeris]
MADTNHASGPVYSPEMDGQSHEATYRGFVRFVEIATMVVICWVLSLAVGGVREAWVTAIIGVVLSSIAGAIGALAPSLGWRAPAVVAALLLLLLAFY